MSHRAPTRRARVLTALLAGALVLTTTVGCSSQSQGEIVTRIEQNVTQEDTRLTFLGYKADSINLTAIEASLHGFMSENPGINIVYEGIKGSLYWETFDKRVAADVMDDVVMIDHDHVIELSSAGKLVDMSDLSVIDNFQPLAKGQFTSEDGCVYFLPTNFSTYGIYINYNLLEQHNQKVPENWSEFAEVCDYFVSQGITPIIANNTSSLRSLIVGKGMYPIYQTSDSEAAVEYFNENPAAIAETLQSGLEMAQTIIERKWIDCDETLETSATSDDLMLFVEGERPFMVTGGWTSPRIDNMKPGFSYGVHPFPILDDGCVLVMDVNTCVSINADSENVEVAKQLVEYLMQPDVLWEYCDSQSSFTPLYDDRMPADPTIVPSAEYLSNGRSVIGSDYRLTVPLDNALLEVSREMMRGMNASDAQAKLVELLCS